MGFWGVCRVFAAPQGEQRALRHFTRNGITAWAPFVTERRPMRGHRGLVQVERPLFPAYVFVRVEEQPCPALWERRDLLRPLLDGGDSLVRIP